MLWFLGRLASTLFVVWVVAVIVSFLDYLFQKRIWPVESISIFPAEWVFYPAMYHEHWDYDNKRVALSRINLGPITIRIRPPLEKQK